MERRHRDVNLTPRLEGTQKGLLKSQSGPLAGFPLTTVSTRILRELSRTVCCCFAVSACRSHFMFTHADVGATLIPFATIVLCVYGLVGETGGLLLSWRQPRCVGKLGRGSRPIS